MVNVSVNLVSALPLAAIAPHQKLVRLVLQHFFKRFVGFLRMEW